MRQRNSLPRAAWRTMSPTAPLPTSARCGNKDSGVYLHQHERCHGAVLTAPSSAASCTPAQALFALRRHRLDYRFLAQLPAQVLLRPSTVHFPAAPGESQMAVNTLRAAELLSDDSNFRAGLIPLLAPTAAHLLASGAYRAGQAARGPAQTFPALHFVLQQGRNSNLPLWSI